METDSWNVWILYFEMDAIWTADRALVFIAAAFYLFLQIHTLSHGIPQFGIRNKQTKSSGVWHILYWLTCLINLYLFQDMFAWYIGSFMFLKWKWKAKLTIIHTET